MQRTMRLFTAGCLLLPAAAWSATPPPASPADRMDQQLRQEQDLEQARRQRESLAQQPAEPEAPDPAPEEGGPCIPVSRILLEGSTALPHSAVRELTAPPESPAACMRLADMRSRVRAVTQAYLARGWLTARAWLPPQRLAGGTLRIAVTEGRIAQPAPGDGLNLPARMALPAGPGDLLNLRDLEQAAENLGRLKTRPVTLDIVPGDAPGTSRLVFTEAAPGRLPASLTLAAGNGGQRSTGSGQVSAALTLDSPLHLADQWSFSASRDSGFRHDRHSRALAGGVTLPYGYWLFSWQSSWSAAYQEVPLQGAVWPYDSSVLSHRAGVSRVLFRDGMQKLALDAGLTHRRTESRLADQRLAVSSPALSVLDAGLLYSRTLAGGWMTLNPGLSRGLDIMGATPDAGGSAPRSGFRKYHLSASWYRPLPGEAWYLTSLYGQTSPDNLYASERIAAGGPWSVRGFKESYMSGNRGAWWRNELGMKVAELPPAGALSVTGALDAGWVRGQTGQADGGSVTGASLGLSLEGKHLQHTLSLSRPLSWPGGLSPDRWVAGWQVAVTL